MLTLRNYSNIHSAGNDYFKTYQGLNSKTKLGNIDGEDVKWGSIADSFIDGSQLRCLTMSPAGYINVWIIDLMRMQPWTSKTGVRVILSLG